MQLVSLKELPLLFLYEEFMHAACMRFGVRSRGQNQGDHKQSSETEMKYNFKLQTGFPLLLTSHFSSSRDQGFDSLRLLHLCNASKVEVI